MRIYAVWYVIRSSLASFALKSDNSYMMIYVLGIRHKIFYSDAFKELGN